MTPILLIFFLIIISAISLLIIIFPNVGYATEPILDKKEVITYPLFTQDEIIDLASATDFSF